MSEMVVVVNTARFVKMEIAEVKTGYSIEAQRSKIKRRVWLEGREYVKAPDGLILIDMEGYERWAAGQRKAG